MNGPLRIVFFGTPEFAVPTLGMLLESPHTVVGVVTQPDKPRGRGQQVVESPVKRRARAGHVPVLQPATLKDAGFLAELRSLDADLGIVAAYGKILSDAVLAVPRLGMLNVHASLLPKYRGAAPVHRAVMAGETETGVTIMRVVKALDAGPMLSKVPVAIYPADTSDVLERRLAVAGATLLFATLAAMEDGTVRETPQDEARATYANKITKVDGIVDWSRGAAEIHNQIRGLYPWPHAYAFLNGERCILLRSRALPESRGGAPGEIVAAEGDELLIATGGGMLALTELQREGRKPVSARNFLAGRGARAGDRFQPEP